MRYAVGRWDDNRWRRAAARVFMVAGNCTSTAAAANECLCNLWNPSSTRSIWLLEFGYGNRLVATALDPLRFCRTTTVGTTPASTITPDLDNDAKREITPISGTVLHIGGFATEPVLATPELYRLAFPVTSGSHSLTWLFRDGIRIPPGTGIALATTGAVAAAATDLYFRFRE